MKFTAKQLNKLSTKHEKEMNKEKKKIKQAIDKGNLEGAKIYAENTIRKKNESLQMLQLASRIDGVASKLQSISASGVRKGCFGRTPGSPCLVRSPADAIGQQLGVAMQSMDTMQIAQSMDQFERQLNDLDVQGTMIGTVMDSSTANSTPVDEVDSLISQVADEAGMSLADKFPEMVQGDAAAAAQPAERSQVCHCPHHPSCDLGRFQPAHSLLTVRIPDDELATIGLSSKAHTTWVLQMPAMVAAARCGSSAGV